MKCFIFFFSSPCVCSLHVEYVHERCREKSVFGTHVALADDTFQKDLVLAKLLVQNLCVCVEGEDVQALSLGHTIT